MIAQERLREVFADVESLPRELLTRQLAEACDGDPELEAELRSLLDAHRRAGSFLEEPPPEPELPKEATLESGSALGCYRLVSKLGRGGMATVWLAVRADGSFQKRVAIKLLRGSWHHDDAIRRFHQERQTLAALEHPCIAGLLDGGTTPDGRPYLVLEYVEGRPLDRYCEEERLHLRERLELFRRVCAAVHFAHQNLVVHRDLKPENILVTAEGTPKLLDFGICKLVNPELTISGPSESPSRSRFMTPEYASPEQARGGPVTTASDVYSLGAILYLLLTGTQLVEAEERTPAAVLHEVCKTTPERPSVRVLKSSSEGWTAGLSRSLAGDLDHIVLRALAREPRRRYGTAGELAADLHRHLTNRPVEARKPTWAYRFGKFLRRHRWGVGAVTALLLLTLGFGLWVAVQQRQLVRARGTSDAVTRFLVELFQTADPLEQGHPGLTARELLDRGAERVESYLTDQPEVQAALQGTLGGIYLRWGALDPARKLLTAALDHQQRLHGGENSEEARILARLGRLHVEGQELDRAEEFLQRSLEIRRRMFGEDHAETADSYNELGFLRHHQGRLDEAADLYGRALGTWEAGGRGSPAEIARALNNLSSVRMQLGDHHEAERLFRRSLRLRERFFGPGSVEASESLHNLSHLLRTTGRPGQARELAENALDIRRRVLGEDHPRTIHTLTILAGLHQDLGELDAAESLLTQIVDAHRRRANGGGTADLAIALNNLGSVVEERGRLAEAETLYDSSLRMLRQTLGETHYAVGLVMTNLARVLDDQGRPNEGLPLARGALEILEAAWGREHERTAVAESVLAGCLIHLGDQAEAEALLRHSLSILTVSRDGRAETWLRRAETLLAKF